jgi:5-formyltetrahydrofolate cyclo-ligase
MVDKQTLRSVYLAKRELLTTYEIEQRKKLVVENFKLWVKTYHLKCIHVFIAIERQKEVDTWPIIHWLWEQNIKTITSITHTGSNNLAHVEFMATTKLSTNKWGIPEPENAASFLNFNELDLVLVPLVVFDLAGNRIGYGKGYYDKFLSQCKPETIKLGIAQTPPLDIIPYMHESDIVLDGCITHLGNYKFTHGKI